eukprot:SAG31_NODE_2716_length_5201_cov_2.881419_3_plen_195_part_00
MTYPTGLVVVKERAYFLGRGKSSNSSYDDIALLARIPTAALLLADRELRWGQLEFWVSPGRWAAVPSADSGGVDSLHFQPLFTDPPPETSLQFVAPLNRWIQLVIPFRSRKLSLRFASELTGPWSDEVVVYNISEPWVDSTTKTFSYSPKTHPALSTNPNELIVTFMSNGPGPVVATDTRLYVPQAVRLVLAED